MGLVDSLRARFSSFCTWLSNGLQGQTRPFNRHPDAFDLACGRCWPKPAEKDPGPGGELPIYHHRTSRAVRDLAERQFQWLSTNSRTTVSTLSPKRPLHEKGFAKRGISSACSATRSTSFRRTP